MANIVDLRRTDLRSNVLENPYWITSREITCPTHDAVVVGLFSFPITLIASSLCEACYGNSKIIIQEAVWEINTAFSGGTPALIAGIQTLDLQTTLAYTDSNENALIESVAGSGVTNSAGVYPLHVTSAFDTARVAGQHATDYVITPADTVVPCITVNPSGGMTGGSAFLHLLIAVVPQVT